MSKKYQVLTASKSDEVSLEDAQTALAEQYPNYRVEVVEVDDEYVAKLTRLAAEDDEDDAGDEAPPAKGKKSLPPFLDEEGDKPAPDDDDDDGDEAEAPKPSKDKDDGDDLGLDDLGDKDKGGSDLSKALKAVETLKSVLPKLEKQLKSLPGGEDLGGDLGGPGGLPGGPDGLPGAPGPGGGPEGLPGGPGPGGLGGPSQSDLDKIGPTPGKPGPGNAAPRVPGLGGGPARPPRPGVGVPTFGNVRKNKFVYRPADDDGRKISLAEASEEIENHPRYAAYEVKDIKLDEQSNQYVAHLKLREN